MNDVDKILAEALGANDDQQEVTMWVDTGYAPLNKAVSGDYNKGLPVGRMIEMFGPPSCGKTAIATEAMISAQRAGGVAAFMDHENSFDVGLAQDLGLDPTTRWVFKRPETFEQALNMTVKLGATLRGYDPETGKRVRKTGLIPDNAPIVVVFDSLASMVPQSKMYDNKGKVKSSEDYSMHDNTALARATSSAFPALAQLAAKYEMCLIFLNQVRTKPGVMYGDPTTTPGGGAPEFYSSVRIGLRREMIKDKDKNILGQTINANVVKNKVSPPFKRASWNFMFRADGTGYFDVDGSLVELLADSGVLKRDGNGYIWTDGKKYMKPALKEKIEAENLRPELMRLLQGTSIGDETGMVDFVGTDEE
jgi:recombination protein RecA